MIMMVIVNLISVFQTVMEINHLKMEIFVKNDVLIQKDILIRQALKI